ncbi:hypothetical protein [Devosia sp. FKR38]|uniref:hypothetical protein n=1 Tax=Devosia sp. FKR38 TaxID=2562312 RepID=UPI0010BF9483|nr:hypothetical protein [Devosia sp. FKR38]
MNTQAETELLAQLAEVVANLHDGGMQDGQAMFMLGAGADRLVSIRAHNNWSHFKAALTPADTIELLQHIDAEGNTALREEKGRQAYALQALALSLAAKDAELDTVRAGAALLDQVIESALSNFRTHAKPALG